MSKRWQKNGFQKVSYFHFDAFSPKKGVMNVPKIESKRGCRFGANASVFDAWAIAAATDARTESANQGVCEL